jgi:hypothetical protein
VILLASIWLFEAGTLTYTMLLGVAVLAAFLVGRLRRSKRSAH